MLWKLGRKYVIICTFLCSSLARGLCQDSDDSDDSIFDDDVAMHILNNDGDRYHSWTLPPLNPPDNSLPVSMAIWISVVLGIFVFMVIAVCCGLFCKYSGKMSSSRQMPSPIPIIITPPSRTHTLTSFQIGDNQSDGYSNQGYARGFGSSSTENGAQNSPPISPTRDVPPLYLDVTSSPGRANLSRIAGKVETPPPAYMTVSPFR